MKLKRSIILDALDDFLKKLDDAPVSQRGLFTSENEKERYETFLMYAYRKYEAAVYHYENVKRFLEAYEAEVQDSKLANIQLKEDKKYPISKFVMQISWTANRYIYELSAFLETLKSSIDFLAMVCCLHLSNTKCDSISKLINRVKSGRTGPIFDEVEKHLEWFEKLRKYRHHVVHRRTFSILTGHETRVIGDVSRTVRYPVIIPDSSPSYVPDTRMKRAMEQGSLGFDSSESETRVKKADGGEEIIRYYFSYYPPPGFVHIEDFMGLHLSLFERFFTEIIHTLSSLDFKLIRNG